MPAYSPVAISKSLNVGAAEAGGSGGRVAARGAQPTPASFLDPNEPHVLPLRESPSAHQKAIVEMGFGWYQSKLIWLNMASLSALNYQGKI